MTLESRNMLSMKKLTFEAEDWQMPWSLDAAQHSATLIFGCESSLLTPRHD